MIDPYEEEDNEITIEWILRLYIVGQTPKSVIALGNMRRLCDTFLQGKVYTTEVIDSLLNPEYALRDQIVVTPTLIRLSPKPIKRVFGDLSNTDKVIASLQLPPRTEGQR